MTHKTYRLIKFSREIQRRASKLVDVLEVSTDVPATSKKTKINGVDVRLAVDDLSTILAEIRKL